MESVARKYRSSGLRDIQIFANEFFFKKTMHNALYSVGLNKFLLSMSYNMV